MKNSLVNGPQLCTENHQYDQRTVSSKCLLSFRASIGLEFWIHCFKNEFVDV